MILELIPAYFGWHYTQGLVGLFTLWGNITAAAAHFFSMPLLLRTLFAPWKRMQDDAQEGDVEDFFATFVVNVLSRIVGVFIRLCVLLIGALVLVVLGAVLFVVFLLWLAAPILAVVSTIYGFTLLGNTP